LFMAKKS